MHTVGGLTEAHTLIRVLTFKVPNFSNSSGERECLQLKFYAWFLFLIKSCQWGISVSDKWLKLGVFFQIKKGAKTLCKKNNQVMFLVSGEWERQSILNSELTKQIITIDW